MKDQTTLTSRATSKSRRFQASALALILALSSGLTLSPARASEPYLPVGNGPGHLASTPEPGAMQTVLTIALRSLATDLARTHSSVAALDLRPAQVSLNSETAQFLIGCHFGEFETHPEHATLSPQDSENFACDFATSHFEDSASTQNPEAVLKWTNILYAALATLHQKQPGRYVTLSLEPRDNSTVARLVDNRSSSRIVCERSRGAAEFVTRCQVDIQP